MSTYTHLYIYIYIHIYVYKHTYIHTHTYVTPWNRVHLQKLTGPQLFTKFPAFYGPEGSLPYSQANATCPSPEADKSSPCPIALLVHLF